MLKVYTASSLGLLVRSVKRRSRGWFSHLLLPQDAMFNHGDGSAYQPIKEGDIFMGYPIHLSPDVEGAACGIMVVQNGERYYLEV